MSLLKDLFITVVNMSITASYVAIGVILVRMLLKKAPKIFSYILWAPVLFRLVCPFSFDSAFSFLNLINLNGNQNNGKYEFIPQNIGLMQTPAIKSGIGSIDRMVNASLPSAISAASVNPMQIWIAVFSLIWIIGVIFLFIYSIISYVKIKRRLQIATRVEANVFETDAISTAFVLGFISPKIYVPIDIGDTDQSYILEHERTHIRRKDYLIKTIAFLALILHWFNPLMWLSFSFMSQDMEMSCDESVLHKLGDSAKSGYSSSLLSLSVKRRALLAANPLAFGENHVKARIKNILNFKKPAFWIIMITVVAVLAAIFAFVANPFQSVTNLSPDRIAILIEENLATIMSSPEYSSNSQDYIDAHQTEYNAILDLGIQALPYLFAEFEKGGQAGLKGHIMQKLCWDILGEDNIQYASRDPQDWYDTFKKHVQKIAASSSVDFIKTNNPKYGALLNVINNPTTEGAAKIVEENISVIMSSPKEASNPYAYISLHKEEYENILKIGKEALPYLIEILKSGDRGLRGNIVAILCEDIVKGLLNENMGVDLETEKLIMEAQTTVDKWKATMGNTSQEMMPEFTEEEVAKARAVVEEYYRAVAAKDVEAVLATMYPREGLTLERVKSGNVHLFGEEKRTLLSIQYSPQDNMRRDYKPGGKYIEPENIIVFKVCFNIDYPGKEMGPWNEGIYDNWSMILIRDSKDSPWLIYDQGY